MNKIEIKYCNIVILNCHIKIVKELYITEYALLQRVSEYALYSH